MVYFKALYRLINMQSNVAKSKAYEGRHILPPYDSRRTCSLARSIGVDFGEGGKSEKIPESTGEINNSTHISSKFDSQYEAIPRWSPIQLQPRPTGLNLT